jgi:phosphatidylserine/phosphatidylglycerophosphate/cardiolipin synthase-like enzyme
VRLEEWFLTIEERGNPKTRIDSRRGDSCAWTEGNDASVLVDGVAYFGHLAEVIMSLSAHDEVRFTDWRGDGDERLTAKGGSIARLLAEACGRDVDVRGLLWRSHSDRLSFSSKENRRLAREVTAAGGEVLLDERVRRSGSHHQKMVVIRRQSPTGDIAFIGGIDLSHGRRDSSAHDGDSQAIELDSRYGDRPAWHDVHLLVQGPAVDDLDFTFRERWEDPTPLNHAGRFRVFISRVTSRRRVPRPLPVERESPAPAGGFAIQVLRTYPARRPEYPFAPEGERSVARAFAKAIERARTLIYIEDQYFWSAEIAHLLAAALRNIPRLQLIVVVPRFPDKDSSLSGPPARLAQARAMRIVKAAGGARVGIYDLENGEGRPTYVHAKVCVIDDVWATVGSDNLNRRSWTHDSELSCAVIDSELDTRAPLDPGGLGDGSRKFARNLRLTLWAEHLGRAPDDPALVDITNGIGLWHESAHRSNAVSRASRVRVHQVDAVPAANRLWAEVLYRLIFDPDGRPMRVRAKGEF